MGKKGKEKVYPFEKILEEFPESKLVKKNVLYKKLLDGGEQKQSFFSIHESTCPHRNALIKVSGEYFAKQHTHRLQPRTRHDDDKIVTRLLIAFDCVKDTAFLLQIKRKYFLKDVAVAQKCVDYFGMPRPAKIIVFVF